MRGGRHAKCTYHSSGSTYDKLGRPRGRYCTEPGLQSSQIRSARLEQQGRKPPVYNVSGSGRQKCPTRTRTPTPSDWETCSGWGNRGSGSGMSCGVRNTGRLDLSASLDADRPAFCFFSAVANQSCAHQHRIQSAAGQLTNKKHRDRLVRKEEKPTPSKPLRLQQFNTPMWIPCPSPSLRPEQTAYAKEKPARCDARRSMQRRNIHISGASRRLRRHGSWTRMPTWMCSLQQVVRYRHA
jgi:hypothetical protein